MSAYYDYAAIARSIYDAYNSRDFDRALSCLGENVEWRNIATGETMYGHEGFRRFMQGWDTAFPDSKVEIVNLFGGEDWVCCEFVGRGTHTGLLLGPAGQIPPTGRSLELHFCDVFHFRDGKVVSGHTYFDLATMMYQLGLMPQQKAA